MKGESRIRYLAEPLLVFCRATPILITLVSLDASAVAETTHSPIEAVFDIENNIWVQKPTEASDRPYPAGSLFKVATAFAALESGIVLSAEHVCNGESCWYPPGHGRLDLKGALAHSCSAYFSNLSGRLDGRAVLALAQALGFEAGGRLRTRSAYAGDDRSLRIRPSRAAVLMAYIATGRPLNGESAVSEPTRLVVRQALLDSVSFGTSSELHRYLPSAGAKTGTSYEQGGELLGWCAGFFPDHRAHYAFAVLVPGATSRQGAVPVAARLLRNLRWSHK